LDEQNNDHSDEVLVYLDFGKSFKKEFEKLFVSFRQMISVTIDSTLEIRRYKTR